MTSLLFIYRQILFLVWALKVCILVPTDEEAKAWLEKQNLASIRDGWLELYRYVFHPIQFIVVLCGWFLALSWFGKPIADFMGFRTDLSKVPLSQLSLNDVMDMLRTLLFGIIVFGGSGWIAWLLATWRIFQREKMTP